MQGGKSKYTEMLEDRDVARWFSQVSQGSKKTAKVYLRGLGYSCERYHTTPHDVAKLDRRGIRDFLVDMINDMDSRGNAGGYIESAVKAVKSWLRFNLRPVGEIRVKIPRLNETPTIANEVVPTREELSRILAAKDIRAKVAVALVAFTSVRPEVVGSTTDGLRLRDLPELKWDPEAKKATFTTVPALVRVRAPISKLGHEYVNFL
ncbi:MAG: site-specific integrase, partial [Nitrososphaerota archaeon]|nr:site-specific integrase [Nitrososphaerota archaeon]